MITFGFDQRIPLDIQSVFRRLGYKEGKTNVQEGELETFTAFMEKEAAVLRVSSSYRFVKNQGKFFSMVNHVPRLIGCRELYLVAVTAGEKVQHRIQHLQEERRCTEALLLDTLASQLVHQGVELLRKREEKVRLPRISPGCGRIPLYYQGLLFQALHLKTLGLQLNSHFILWPEKSLVAVFGCHGE